MNKVSVDIYIHVFLHVWVSVLIFLGRSCIAE